MDLLRRTWKKVPVAVRKPLILVAGTAIIVGGIILLPLPGPGWVVIFFGLAVLATEFAFAERLRDWVIAQLKAFAQRSKKAWKNRKKGS